MCPQTLSAPSRRMHLAPFGSNEIAGPGGNHTHCDIFEEPMSGDKLCLQRCRAKRVTEGLGIQKASGYCQCRDVMITGNCGLHSGIGAVAASPPLKKTTTSALRTTRKDKDRAKPKNLTKPDLKTLRNPQSPEPQNPHLILGRPPLG